MDMLNISLALRNNSGHITYHGARNYEQIIENACYFLGDQIKNNEENHTQGTTDYYHVEYSFLAQKLATWSAVQSFTPTLIEPTSGWIHVVVRAYHRLPRII
jgi:hypothetical protein